MGYTEAGSMVRDAPPEGKAKSRARQKGDYP